MSEHDVTTEGAELADTETGEWLTPRGVTGPLVVLVHGFTSHGRYMERLAKQLRGHGYVTAVFNHDSYLGIDVASADLGGILEGFMEVFEKEGNKGFVLVAHSMGGLVARHFARHGPV